MDDWSELKNLVWDENYKEAQRMLDINPHLLDKRNSLGETVMHFLAVENDMAGVKWLYQRGFDINTKNEFGQSLFYEVASLEHKEFVDWLIEIGVDVSAKDNSGDDIFTYLKFMEKNEMLEYLNEKTT